MLSSRLLARFQVLNSSANVKHDARFRDEITLLSRHNIAVLSAASSLLGMDGMMDGWKWISCAWACQLK